MRMAQPYSGSCTEPTLLNSQNQKVVAAFHSGDKASVWKPTPPHCMIPIQFFFAALAAAASSFSIYFAGLALKRDSHLWQQKRSSRSGLPSCL